MNSINTSYDSIIIIEIILNKIRGDIINRVNILNEVVLFTSKEELKSGEGDYLIP